MFYLIYVSHIFDIFWCRQYGDSLGVLEGHILHSGKREQILNQLPPKMIKI